MTEIENHPLRTYGGRNGRKLSKRQRELIDAYLPKLVVELPPAGALKPESCFPDASEVWLEIGFGGGEHVSGQARRSQDIGILASEVFSEGVAKLLGQIEDEALRNIRIWPRDGREMVDRLADRSIDRAFILFPDPWPKTRHHKRRLIQPAFLDSLSRAMKTNGRVRFATDVRSYADEALERFISHSAFHWTARNAGDWRTAPSDHIKTRYQMKNLGDIKPVYFDFIVNPKH